DRIALFISILLRNRAKILRHGCPVGTLCAELAKLGHGHQAEANSIMELFRTWLRGQFTQLGRENDADTLALHLLARTQGVAVVAQSLRDKAFVQHEVEQMLGWVEACKPTRAASARRSR